MEVSGYFTGGQSNDAKQAGTVSQDPHEHNGEGMAVH
jgi:hypothetical protein